MSETYDLIVIGMGVGGEEVAGRTAEAGLKVLAIEKNLVGGECPYWGCIPSKMMIRAADLLAEAKRIPGMAGESTVSPDWTPVADRVRDQATDDWNDKVAVERHEKKGSTVLKGAARFVGPKTVEVDGTRYDATTGIVIAIGTDPAVLPIEGLDSVDYWTNRTAIETKEVPSSLIVLGGGPIGLELAQVFGRFGSKVTVVEMAEHLLPLEEPENGQAIEDALREEGFEVFTGTAARKVAKDGDEVVVTLGTGEEVRGERLLVATGRKVDLRSLGVGAAGLDEDARVIEVDEHMRAGDAIWAIGDATNHGGFTHLAVYQGRIAAADVLGTDHAPADYSAVPRVTFTDPEVASVGLTEKKARDEGINVKVSTAKTASSARGWLHGPGAEHGVTKLVVDADKGVLVGASTMGPRAGDVIGFLGLAVKEQIPISALKELIYPYPTFVRGIEDALVALD